MSLSAFGFSTGYIVNQLLGIPGFMLFLCFRGFCEAWTAHKLGDNTAYLNGYMTLNPRKHINPIGFIFLIIFGFGFSNPVPVNTRNFKNVRRDNALQILSSPISGIVLMTASVIVYYVLFIIGVKAGIFIAPIGDAFYALTLARASAGSAAVIYNALLNILYQTAVTSVYLSIFFLLPIPGFDGYRLIANFLPYKYYSTLYNIEKYSMYIFMGFIILLRLIPGFSLIIQIPASLLLNLVSLPFEYIIHLIV